MIGIGILGAGHFGAAHSRAIAATPGARLAAVCAESTELAESFAAKHGGRPYGDWQLLLDDPSVDAVVIATPHHLHSEMAVAAAGAGKHILLEKPMTQTASECSAIVANHEFYVMAFRSLDAGGPPVARRPYRSMG
jgi:phthalate 4,5-cis-dihydrodiol dehydrogenase